MTTFKHNSKVTCKIDGVEITDARISIDKDGTPYICQNIQNGSETDDKLGYKHSWVLKKDFTDNDVTDLKLAEKSWDNLEVGDVLVDKKYSEYKCMILGICDKVYFISIYNDFEKTGKYFTIQELQERLTLDTPTPETIEHNGKKYDKVEFEGAISNLNEIK